MQDHVTANYRYISAYNEINARIAQRQQGLNLYITLFIGLLAALVGIHGFYSAAADHVEWLLLGFPVAAAGLTLLNFKNERLITNLRTYLSELEKLGEGNVPAYNLDERWIRHASSARRFYDYACAILVLASTAGAIGAFFVIFPNRFTASLPIVLIVSVLGCGFAVAHLLLHRQRYGLRGGE